MVKESYDTIIERRTVNRHTGEIISADSRVERFEAFNGGYYSEDKGYKLRARSGKAIRMSLDIDLPISLSNTDLGRLYVLSRCMWVGTGVLAHKINGKIIPFCKKEMHEIMGFKSEKQGRTFINRLIKLQLLRRVDVHITKNSIEEQWYINPLYFWPAYINRNMYLLWHDQIDKFIPDFVKELFKSEKQQV